MEYLYLRNKNNIHIIASCHLETSSIIASLYLDTCLCIIASCHLETSGIIAFCQLETCRCIIASCHLETSSIIVSCHLETSGIIALLYLETCRCIIASCHLETSGIIALLYLETCRCIIASCHLETSGIIASLYLETCRCIIASCHLETSGIIASLYLEICRCIIASCHLETSGIIAFCQLETCRCIIASCHLETSSITVSCHLETSGIIALLYLETCRYIIASCHLETSGIIASLYLETCRCIIASCHLETSGIIASLYLETCRCIIASCHLETSGIIASLYLETCRCIIASFHLETSGIIASCHLETCRCIIASCHLETSSNIVSCHFETSGIIVSCHLETNRCIITSSLPVSSQQLIRHKVATLSPVQWPRLTSYFMSLRCIPSLIMRAIRVAKFGGVENLKLESNLPVPTPADYEVLIKVYAAGINPVDTYIRSGTYSRIPQLPYTPGQDAAGIVEAVGEGVTQFKKGDRVLTMTTTSGTYAEFTTANVKFVAHLDEKLSFAQGASFGVPYYTAYKSLFIRAQGKPGETVFVHGASGGVGLAAVQLAKAHGLRVVGTAGTQEGVDLVKRNGADFVFNHREEGYFEKISKQVEGGIDIVLEMLANVNLQNDLNIVNFRGRIVVVGCRGSIEINPRVNMMKESNIMGVALMTATEAEWKQMHAALEAGQKAGFLAPHVGKTYPLEEAANAQNDVINNTGTLGNLILQIAS
ncbi:hypothetical protein Btru_013249 [Bulinus truncatus]|nr:hypothetical protein Btru_013249 [Bulinus truncatus]